MNYFATYSYYHGCPTCEGVSDIAYKTDTYDSRQEMVKYIQEQMSDTRFWAIYKFDEYGEVTKVSDVNYQVGGHNVMGADFKFDGFDYTMVRTKNRSVVEFDVVTNNPT